VSKLSIIIDGQEISKNIQDTIKANVKGFMIRPSVAVIQIGDNAENNSYISIKEKVCSSVGIYFRLFKFEEGTPELTIINKIKELNNDDYVNGIMIHLPIPANYNEKRLINTISNAKDVDGLTDINVGRFVNGKKTLVPCTALAVMRILEENNIEVEGKHVVIVGRSKLVGKPLINSFLLRDATVTVTHSKTENLGDITSLADILVVAAGEPNLIKDSMVKKDAVVIDVGINDVDGKLVGDVDFDKVSKKASYITKVPGGVGPVTVAMLLENILLCYNTKNSKK
jgi:methylenetetrahydrofolate dehydrogenase (NADP+)/methenyltetrahydrofolate cyclohydrolase